MMLERFECSVCKRYVSMDTDNPLHYTNWKLSGSISKPICSENCKKVVELEVATERARRHALNQSQSQDRRNRLDKAKRFLSTCLLDQSKDNDITDIWWTIKDILDESEDTSDFDINFDITKIGRYLSRDDQYDKGYPVSR
jgi:hypothetical protein